MSALGRPGPSENLELLDPLEVVQMDERALALHETRAAIAAARAEAKAAKARIDAMLTVELAELENREQDLEGALGAWLKDVQQREAEQGYEPRVTIKLPCRLNVMARTMPAAWEYGDEKALVAWAQASAPAAVRTKVELDKVALKRVMRVEEDGTAWNDETGEQVPGVTVTPGETRYSVTGAEK